MSPNVENIHKLTQYTHFLFCSITKMTSLAWNNLFMVRLVSTHKDVSYAKMKLQMCWVTQHQCRSRQMWKIFTISPSRTHLFESALHEKWPVLTQQSIHGKLSTHYWVNVSFPKNKQLMCWVTQHQCIVAKCGKYSQIHPVLFTRLILSITSKS